MGIDRVEGGATVCLVRTPRWIESPPYVPLGLLCLKGALQGAGILSCILDFDAINRRGELPAEGDALLAAMARRAASTEARVFGVTTECPTYPGALRFCQLLKRERPDATIVLGGPHAGLVPRETMAAFPEIDLVVIGEGEETFPELVRTLLDGGDTGTVAGIVRRDGGAIVATPARPPVMDLDRLPRPDFSDYTAGDLAERFSSPGRRTYLQVEVGRGCSKACSFCSSHAQWVRHRAKSPRAVVDEMVSLNRSHGILAFELTCDNIASHPEFLPEFCAILTGMGSPFAWSCAVSADLVELPFAETMAKAGCSGVFIGIETASPAVQRAIGKNLDLPRAEALLLECLRLGMTVGAAFIVGFPGETAEDIDRTLAMAARIKTAGDELLLLSQLSLLPGSPLYRRHLRDAALGEHYCCTCVPPFPFTGQREMIAAHPELFSSFYTVRTPALPDVDMGWMVLFYHALMLFFPQPLANLLAAASAAGDGPVAVFRHWDRWRRERHPEAAYSTDTVFFTFSDFLDHYADEIRRCPGSPADH